MHAPTLTTEAAVRRVAKRQGLALRKSRTTGRFSVINDRRNWLVAEALTLNEAHDWLTADA